MIIAVSRVLVNVSNLYFECFLPIYKNVLYNFIFDRLPENAFKLFLSKPIKVIHQTITINEAQNITPSLHHQLLMEMFKKTDLSSRKKVKIFSLLSGLTPATISPTKFTGRKLMNPTNLFFLISNQLTDLKVKNVFIVRTKIEGVATARKRRGHGKSEN